MYFEIKKKHTKYQWSKLIQTIQNIFKLCTTQKLITKIFLKNKNEVNVVFLIKIAIEFIDIFLKKFQKKIKTIDLKENQNFPA